VADVPGEEGLWYRLASVTYIGGTLGGPVASVDPFAAAALGSVVLHGRVHAPHTAHFTALMDAGASRQVRDVRGLGRAVEDLLAPDRAAELAHRAWAVVSQGAEATDHVADAVGRILDQRR
jgi:3-deoxy-D-manno-octulosonic-acid transferase